MRRIVYKSNEIILDEGIFFGRGVFETILSLEKPIFLKEHLERLERSLKILGMEELEKEELISFLDGMKVENKVLKVLVTPANIIVTEREIPYKEEDYKNKMTLKVSEVLRNSTSKMCYIKWNGYIENLLEKEEAKKNGFNDALFINEKGYVAETSCANIFIIKDARILTPKIQDGLLGGIIREWIIKEFDVLEVSITLKELKEADEVFITNSIMGIMPIKLIDDRVYETSIFTNIIRDKYINSRS